MHKKLPHYIFTPLLLLIPQFAAADDRSQKIEDMQEKIQILMQEIKALKVSDKKQILKIAKSEKISLDNTQNNIKIAPPSAQDIYGSGFEVAMSPSPKITVGDFSWQPFGEILIDSAFFNDDQFDHPDGSELRSVRFGMRGNLGKNLSYVLEPNFSNSTIGLVNVFIDYKIADNGIIRVGNNRSPYSLEGMTNTNYTTFAEFSAPTAAFDVGEIIGIAGHFNGDNWVAGLGLYNQNTRFQDNDDEGWRVAGRVAISPIKDKNTLLHLAVSAAHVESRDTTNAFTFRGNAENAIQTTSLVQATVANADSHDLFGFEAATVYGPLSFQGEYYHTNVNAQNSAADATFKGGYVQASYFLTGERRPYVDGNATFGRIVPHHDFINGHGAGAWEIAARYSNLNLNDTLVKGGELNSYTVGVNWYLNQYTRLMANYIATDTDANAFSAANDSPSVFLLRSQIIF
ncbi:MAG: phosphate-selective porin OprO/OprP [Alphaproteobacteria bacterium]|jgi:phosphate-selective porin OprO/OprP